MGTTLNLVDYVHPLPEQPPLVPPSDRKRPKKTWGGGVKLESLESRASTTLHWEFNQQQPEYECAHGRGLTPHHSVDNHKTKFGSAIQLSVPSEATQSTHLPVITIKFMTEAGPVVLDFMKPQPSSQLEPFFSVHARASGPFSFELFDESCDKLAAGFVVKASGWSPHQMLSLLKFGLGQAFAREAGIEVPDLLALKGTQTLGSLQTYASAYFLAQTFSLFRHQIFVSSMQAGDYTKNYAKPVAFLIGDVLFSLRCILNQAIFHEYEEDFKYALGELRRLHRLLNPPGGSPMFPSERFNGLIYSNIPEGDSRWVTEGHCVSLRAAGLFPSNSLLGTVDLLDELHQNLIRREALSVLDCNACDYIMEAISAFTNCLEVRSCDTGTSLYWLGILDYAPEILPFITTQLSQIKFPWDKAGFTGPDDQLEWVPISLLTGVLHHTSQLTNKTCPRARGHSRRRLPGYALRRGDQNEVAIDDAFVCRSDVSASIVSLAESTGLLCPTVRPSEHSSEVKLWPFAVPETFGRVMVVVFAVVVVLGVDECSSRSHH